MSLPTNTFTSFDAIGNREDLENIIYDISPMDTPFLSRADKVKAAAVFHEWQTDALASAAANKQLEGDDATGNTLSATTRLGNYCQISRKVVVVSGTQRAVNSAGRRDEYSYQTAKAGKELKRDMEHALTRNQASDNGSEATARSLGSIESWLFSATGNVTDGTGGTTPEYSAGVSAPTDASSSNLITFTEARLKTVIKQCWEDGGDPRVVMVGPVSKQNASQFDGIASLTRETGSSKKQASILGAADLYISDFGEHRIVANRFSRDRTALVLDMDFWAVASLRPIQMIPLAKTGDADKTELLVEFTLVARQPSSSGKVADLITS